MSVDRKSKLDTQGVNSLRRTTLGLFGLLELGAESFNPGSALSLPSTEYRKPGFPGLETESQESSDSESVPAEVRPRITPWRSCCQSSEMSGPALSVRVKAPGWMTSTNGRPRLTPGKRRGRLGSPNTAAEPGSATKDCWSRRFPGRETCSPTKTPACRNSPQPMPTPAATENSQEKSISSTASTASVSMPS